MGGAVAPRQSERGWTLSARSSAACEHHRWELAAEYLAERFQPRKHRLGFGPLGASTSGRQARDAEEMLAEGFGRDSLRS
jgi:hypothetical protein